jgi:hypothetical protein
MMNRKGAEGNIVTHLKIIFRHSLGGTEENHKHKNLGQGSQCSGRYSNRELPEWKSKRYRLSQLAPVEDADAHSRHEDSTVRDQLLDAEMGKSFDEISTGRHVILAENAITFECCGPYRICTSRFPGKLHVGQNYIEGPSSSLPEIARRTSSERIFGQLHKGPPFVLQVNSPV